MSPIICSRLVYDPSLESPSEVIILSADDIDGDEGDKLGHFWREVQNQCYFEYYNNEEEPHAYVRYKGQLIMTQRVYVKMSKSLFHSLDWEVDLWNMDAYPDPDEGYYYEPEVPWKTEGF